MNETYVIYLTDGGWFTVEAPNWWEAIGEANRQFMLEPGEITHGKLLERINTHD